MVFLFREHQLFSLGDAKDILKAENVHFAVDKGGGEGGVSLGHVDNVGVETGNGRHLVEDDRFDVVHKEMTEKLTSKQDRK